MDKSISQKTGIIYEGKEAVENRKFIDFLLLNVEEVGGLRFQRNFEAWKQEVEKEIREKAKNLGYEELNFQIWCYESIGEFRLWMVGIEQEYENEFSSDNQFMIDSDFIRKNGEKGVERKKYGWNKQLQGKVLEICNEIEKQEMEEELEKMRELLKQRENRISLLEKELEKYEEENENDEDEEDE